MACQAVGTPFKPGRKSILGQAQAKYNFKPPPAQAKPPPVSTDLVVSGISITSPKITLSLQRTQALLQELLRKHETTLDHPSSGEQVEFAKQIMLLN